VTYLERFRVTPGTAVKLKDVDPGFTDRYKSKEEAATEIERDLKRLGELQTLLHANRAASLLICLQAMDTGGKDGTISHVLGAMNPQGCHAVAFGPPSAEESAHDFLWRGHRATPAKGEVIAFNRSHYEDVLIVRAHNLVPKTVWSARYDRINSFEDTLAESQTHILKFYLHISKEEQLKRLEARLDDPSKRWKVSESDYVERQFWDDYMAAYEDALSRCSARQAPWFIIPANHKWFRNLAVARIIVEYLEGLKMKYPEPSVDIDRIRKKYHLAKHTNP
jgi:PPK2 family polyphosphate:nucleotide phosphotransferase